MSPVLSFFSIVIISEVIIRVVVELNDSLTNGQNVDI
jgi:hypothetical protein